jgi:cytidylate kinase/pantoate ligase/cytidylate kinase
MIVTIDGPAGAGKSTVARCLAQRLGFRFLDTGAMYRAVAWAALHAGIDLANAEILAQLAQSIRLEIRNDQVVVDGRDVSDEIRTHEVTSAVRYAAANVAVRGILADLQRQFAGEGDLVTEGRDQGTAVFPHAHCKIFLTASAEERARRRHKDLLERGDSASLAEVLESQNRRDASDESREVGPLARAADAVELVTDGMSQEQVIEHLVDIVRSKAG